MSIEELLDQASKSRIHLEKERKRASQILAALEGLSVWEARELLEDCQSSIELLKVSYSLSCCDTTL